MCDDRGRVWVCEWMKVAPLEFCVPCIGQKQKQESIMVNKT
jgi:hypothetical protein